MSPHSVVVFVVLLAISANSGPAPEIVTNSDGSTKIKCPKGLNDEELSQCATDYFNHMKPMFAKGIPEIGLQPLDPFKLDKYDFVLNLFPLIITAKFKDIMLTHLTKCEDVKIKLNTAAKTMEFEFKIPKLRAEADWALTGNVPVIFQLIGNGDAWIDISGGKVRGRTAFKIGTGPNGKEIVQMNRLRLDMDYESAKIQMNNIFGNHPTFKLFGPLINRVANEYQKELYHIIKPLLADYVAEIAQDIINKSFAKTPALTEYF